MWQFECDEDKAATNLHEHRIAFRDVTRVFYDDRAIVEDDPDPDEERFRITGMTSAGRFVLVVYAERSADTIRIISARKATKHEIKTYRQG
jgi:uncharacterized protein